LSLQRRGREFSAFQMSQLSPTPIKNALQSSAPIDSIRVQGWVRTRRDAKDFSFIELNDGSSVRNLQIIAKEDALQNYADIQRLSTGASIIVEGALLPSQGKGQKWELVARDIELVGGADESYPLQKKGHTPEFLREIAHLRPRSNLFGCVFRVRSRLAFAVHQFFQDRGFVYVHTPIITGSDCEGAGELFRVSTIDIKNPPRKNGEIDYAQDFFARQTYLTVSGQLEAEAFACALTKVYTFGPTFRAENSNTSRHASEFWMIEPEMAFCDLIGNMDLAEELVKYLIGDARKQCPEELDLFAKFVDKELFARLDFVIERPFQRITYTDAVELLKKSGEKFEFPIDYGLNLQSEHERWLTEKHFTCPVTVFNFPKEIKPFYMRSNDDGRTVAAIDLLVPGIGEIVGGSQREERLEMLEDNMRRHNMDPADYKWYLDLRRYGTVPHSGFGLGFERILMFITGISNIRDVIPFARTPGSAEF
jgi:asparaginyl-tRNA synthetase